MPELAELKFTADYVNQVSEGAEYVSVNKNPEHKCEDLDIPFKSYRIKAESKGKEMVLAILDNNSDQIIPIRMTMGMSGYFKLTNSGQEPKHSHLKFNRKDGTTLSFVDVRRFGKWKQGLWWNDTRGEDPTTSFDSFWKDIMTNLTSRAFKKPLYEVLMNQKYFNGIGNYLRAEIIFRAEDVDPFLPAGMQLAKYPKILQLCKDIPMLAYAKGGGSIRDWDNPFGDETIQERFMLCYGNGEMSKRKDRNGRMFWYDPKWDNVPTSRDDLKEFLHGDRS